MNLSVVIPCLNEAETLGLCIKKAKNQIKKLKINAEIIVSDNGSTDDSKLIAKKMGAKVIECKKKGYGYAVINGIKKSKGEYIIIADADNSYDFNDMPKFYNKIKKGFDIIQGCRMPKGGGKIEKDAMPLTHKFIGNPLFTSMVKKFYGVKFNDVYCGMKIIRRDFFKKANFFSGGMVFCLEILIKSKMMNAKADELPITLYRDGRKNSKSHLKTIEDGLKTLKFILISSPNWVFFLPSILSLLLSSIIIFIPKKFFFMSSQNTLIFTSLLFFLSFQLFMLGLFSSVRAKALGLNKSLWIDNFFKIFSLRLAFTISLIIFISPILYTVLDFQFFQEDYFVLVTSLMFFLTFSLIGNSLAISLLYLNK